MMLRLYEMFITKETLHTAPSREGKQKRDTRLSQFTSLQLRLSEHWHQFWNVTLMRNLMEGFSSITIKLLLMRCGSLNHGTIILRV